MSEKGESSRSIDHDRSMSFFKVHTRLSIHNKRIVRLVTIKCRIFVQVSTTVLYYCHVKCLYYGTQECKRNHKQFTHV